tara:strand:- start:715 stop:1017 length:303 start_codon:yes stop_codon:yes gene_type:complete
MTNDNDFSSPPVSGISHILPTSRDRAQGELFKLIADIKRSLSMLKSEYSEIKQQYRTKIRLLKNIENQVFENYETDQLELFQAGISLSPEAQKLLQDPSI